ncbi:DNA sulfur modification protein DndE [Methanosarcina mazei]|jgi:DNA sulfur modification protein DndE|uniref:DNA sulfur modification protein DndE n=1 Tax=Methanosarcina mazei TaxID=2209 RepID=A0A0F8GBW2_METMZ|nr:DNA sulfur modification protein DndE [Methanosarcina mazei]KKF99592.1 DNA sulfur modification protein DndE [Methanosarcina mazei]KKG27611.1 DNA sulfur modification protein DndE [Methanosarcina mazei]KKG36623.1 DNA sulfur modification protein DndE [Methanosarcina mazei]KKH34853.1 DNA sulfur modification protein DndE [Methanosarcina mazei]KKH39151.1 DNA sulfur modification protein DndE [Methanosarcina mazei]
MKFNRIRISKGATVRLQQLKGRTGLTPNIFARMAICYSLNDPQIPDPSEYDEEGQELNRYTLTGEWDSFFIALMKERCVKDGLNPEEDLVPQFRAHLNRGVYSIFSRIKNLGDIKNLLTEDN